jgi:hypothetical protein
MTPVSRQTCTGANFKKNFKTCKGMKNVPKLNWALSAIVFLLGVNLVFNACKKSEPLTEKAEVPVYTKPIVVSDDEGNSVQIEVSGDNEARINELNSSHFYLWVTNIKPYNNVTDGEQTLGKKDAFALWNESNTISIEIKNVDFKSNITGFRVDIRPETDIMERGEWDLISYRSSSDNVHGIYALYNFESCSNENVDLDLDKKQACSNWFWQDLASGYLSAPSDDWSSYTSNNYCKWRFRYQYENECAAPHSITWWWWL